MIFMVDGVLGVVDAATGRLIRERRIGREGMVGGTEVALGDIDGDGFEELAVADGGRVHLLDGRTFETSWSTIDIQQQIQRVWITNVDDDPAGEIVFLNHTLQAYDGIAGTLEWQMPLDGNISAIDVGDVNRDGIFDAVIGTYDGYVRVVDGQSSAVIAERQVSEGDVWAVHLANVDDSEELEVVVAAGSLEVMRSSDLQTLWKSEPLGPLEDRVSGLRVVDVDADKRMDILYATAAGVFRFENQAEYRDITLPFVVSTFPTQAFERAGVDVVPYFDFSETVVASENSVVRLTADGESLPADLQYEAAKRRLSVVPRAALPPDASIEVVITTDVTDEAGLPLDGNRNDRPDGSPTDDFVLRFTTGSSVDNMGPAVYLVDHDLGEIWQGMVIDLRVSVADTSSVAGSLVSYVEVFVDVDGDAGTGIALAPVGGRFDASIIDAIGRIRTESMSEGAHQLFIRARDSVGNWGEATTARFSIRSWQRDAWTTYGGEAGRSGSSDVAVRPPLSAKWQVPINEMGYATPPVVAGGRVFLGWTDAIDGLSISAYDIATGKEAWRYVVGAEGIVTGLTYAYGRIFFHLSAIYDGTHVVALDAQSGLALWDESILEYSSGNWYSAPVVHDGMVVVGGDLRLAAYDATTGEPVWRVNEMQYDVWMPAASGGMVYSFWEGHLAAYEIATGERIWQVPVPLRSSWGWQSTVVVDPHTDLLYLGSYDEVFAVDRRAKEVVWHYEGVFLGPPAVDDAGVYLTSPGLLRILEKTTGTVSREVELAYEVSGSQLLIGDFVYLPGTYVVHAVAKATGEVEWSANVGGQLAAADGHVFLTRSSSYYEKDGGLYAFVSADRVATEHEEGIPTVMAIHGNYPNPFNPATTIAFTLAEASRVRMIVYDVVGREVARLIDDSRLPGSYDVVFDAANLPSGVYFVRLESANKVLTRSLTLLK